MRKIIVALMIASILGCSTKYSSLDEKNNDGRKIAYIATKQDLMNDAELGMIRAFPGRTLTKIDGEKAFGFSTWTRVLLDTFSQQIVFFQVKGINDAGEEVDAYAFEISGSGTSGTGAMRNKKFAKEIRALLDSKYKAVTAK